MSNRVVVDYYPKTKHTPKHTPKADAKVSVVGGTVDTCLSTPTNIAAITSGVVAKIPVVLAELTLRVNINSIIKLPEFAYEIKDIKKKVKVTQCFLVPQTGMLFIKGFIRKNIQYATRVGSTLQSFYGDIRHFTADIPFTCTTDVTFNGIPPAPIVNSTSNEFVYNMRQDVAGKDFGTKDKLLSSDLTEYNQVSTEFFNELPYCDLVSATIVELDEALNPTFPPFKEVPFEERMFERIEEKMVLDLTLKILQNRQVAIPPIIGVADYDC